MASLAEKRKADAEERAVDPQARPEELRLLEALLFASSEPLDPATLAKRTPEDAGPAADIRYYGSLPVAVQPGGAERPSGPRGTEGDGPGGFAAAVRLQRSNAVG